MSTEAAAEHGDTKMLYWLNKVFTGKFMPVKGFAKDKQGKAPAIAEEERGVGEARLRDAMAEQRPEEL